MRYPVHAPTAMAQVVVKTMLRLEISATGALGPSPFREEISRKPTMARKSAPAAPRGMMPASITIGETPGRRTKLTTMKITTAAETNVARFWLAPQPINRSRTRRAMNPQQRLGTSAQEGAEKTTAIPAEKIADHRLFSRIAIRSIFFSGRYKAEFAMATATVIMKNKELASKSR